MEQVGLTNDFYKCSVDSELGLLGLMVDDGCTFFCVDMHSKKAIWKTEAQGAHTHHWVTIREQKYLSLQTKTNEVKMFTVDAESKAFKENEALRLCLGEEDRINFTEFDTTFENIFILKNGQMLEKRDVDSINEIKMSIELEEELGGGARKQLSISNDGTFCAIGGGVGKKYFYVVDLQNAQQHKFVSEALTNTFAPCFINGQTELVAVGDWGKDWVEIWDINTQKAVKVLEINKGDVECSASTNNILAIATQGKFLGLWDVRNWEMIYSKEFSMEPKSLHLT